MRVALRVGVFSVPHCIAHGIVPPGGMNTVCGSDNDSKVWLSSVESFRKRLSSFPARVLNQVVGFSCSPSRGSGGQQVTGPRLQLPQLRLQFCRGAVYLE